jgi:hypothetical protein
LDKGTTTQRGSDASAAETESKQETATPDLRAGVSPWRLDEKLGGGESSGALLQLLLEGGDKSVVGWLDLGKAHLRASSCEERVLKFTAVRGEIGLEEEYMGQLTSPLKESVP